MDSFASFMDKLLREHLGIDIEWVEAAKLTPEEIKRINDLDQRARALKRGVERAVAKLQSDNDRIMADLKDKYNLHGDHVHFDAEKGALMKQVRDDK